MMFSFFMEIWDVDEDGLIITVYQMKTNKSAFQAPSASPRLRWVDSTNPKNPTEPNGKKGRGGLLDEFVGSVGLFRQKRGE
jgi:hypothetical protein